MSRKKSAIVVGAIIVLFAVVITVASQGCLSVRGDAEEVVSKVFALIQDEDYESVIEYYSDEFFEATSEEEWLLFQPKIYDRLGDLVSYDLNSWTVNTRMGTDSGTCVTLTYDTEYANYHAVEIVSLEKTGQSGLKITGHHIESPAFLPE